MAVRNAWARTLQLSSKLNLQESSEADRAKNQMDVILKRANEGKDYDEKKYVNEVYSAIESTFRTLATARNGLDINFGEVEKIRQKRVADFEHVTTFSSDLQSLIPRLATMTIGSTITGWAFLNNILQNLFPSIIPEDIELIILPLMLALGAAIGYFVHGLVVVRWNAKRVQKEILKTDYDKTLYYKLYYNRISSALEHLYDTVNRLHAEIFTSVYTTVEAKDAVKGILTGMNLDDQMCKYINEHINKKNIDADIWVICETGINVEKCKHYCCR